MNRDQTVIRSMKLQAAASGCNGTGCDLVRWMKTAARVSATCSICHRIYSREI